MTDEQTMPVIYLERITTPKHTFTHTCACPHTHTQTHKVNSKIIKFYYVILLCVASGIILSALEV